jgi:hypothetical protein
MTKIFKNKILVTDNLVSLRLKRMEIVNKATHGSSEDLRNITSNLKTQWSEDKIYLLKKIQKIEESFRGESYQFMGEFNFKFTEANQTINTLCNQYDIVINSVIDTTNTVSILTMSGQHVIQQMILFI